MRPAKDKNRFKSLIIRQKVEHLFDQIALHDLETQVKTVESELYEYVKQAQELHDLSLESLIWNTLGVWYGRNREFNLSVEAYEESSRLAILSDDLYAQIRSIYNQSAVYFDMQQYTKVVECCMSAFALIHPEKLSADYTLRFKLFILNTTALAYTRLRNFAEAEEQIRRFFELWQDPAISRIQGDYLAALVRQMRLVSALVRINQSDFAGATAQISLFMDLSQQEQLHHQVIRGYLLSVLLALCDPTHETTPENYWVQVDAHLTSLLTGNDPGLTYAGSSVCLQAAEDFEYFGYYEWALRCLRKTVFILDTIGAYETRVEVEQRLRRLIDANLEKPV